MKDYKLSEIRVICMKHRCSNCPIESLCAEKINYPCFWEFEEWEEKEQENESSVTKC